MKTTKRKGLGSESGQVLPITVLFMGVIIGAAAISIDVAKVSALRNQAQTATSAAALAAAQTLAGELQAGSSANGATISSPGSPTQEADIIYHSNIETAIPNSGLSTAPTVEYYLGGGSPVTVLPSSINSNQLPIYITVQANGSTPMNFAAALGVSSAKVKPLATAVVTTQTEASTTGMVPLAMPASAVLPSSSPYGVGGWDNYLIKGQYFDAYRGSSSGKTPSWVTGGTPINFHNIYGSGGMGWLANFSSLSQLDFEDYNAAGGTGSSYWNNLAAYGITPQATVYFPVGNPNPKDNNGSNSTIPIVGFVTAKIISVSGQTGTNAGFEFQVQSQVALNDTNIVKNSSIFGANYLTQLVSNGVIP